jgi:formate-dependent nitrite reductase membrane component NrfD
MPDQTMFQTSTDVPWAAELRHRPDPNRVARLEIPRDAAGTARTPVTTHARPPVPYPQDPSKEPSYYDVSPLKSPPWKWEIAGYFFLGGLSAGAYAISRMAECHGGERYRDVTRVGAWTALLSFLPCPPLLIHDLGDPKRFHHMLRIFKPSSPMSLGTWTLIGYSGMAATQVIREYLRDNNLLPEARTKLSKLTRSTLLLVHDAAGVPFALLVAGYTGVLLSCTANPLWSKNKWLGPLFSASAISTGAAAINLFLPKTADEQAHAALEKIDTAAHVAEAACLAGFLKEAGPKARPLTHGKVRGHFYFTLIGLALSEVLKLIPFRRGTFRRFAGKLSSIVTLGAGFSLRWGMVYGGHEAAQDPHTARLVSKPDDQHPKLQR